MEKFIRLEAFINTYYIKFYKKGKKFKEKGKFGKPNMLSGVYFVVFSFKKEK